MDLRNEDLNGVLVVEPLEERLDASSATGFKEKVSLLIKQGYDRLVLNLRKVEFIDSTGMTAIVSLLKILGLKNGEMVVCEVGPSVKNLLKLTKLDRVFVVCATEQEAIKEIKSGPPHN